MVPLNPRFAERLRWMETESRFMHACPDLDQEVPEHVAQGAICENCGQIVVWCQRCVLFAAE